MKKIIVFLLVVFTASLLYSADKNKSKKEINLISIDTDETKLSPNGDGFFENINFRISFLQDKLKIKDWRLTIINAQTNEVFDKFSGQKEIPNIITWKGEDRSGKVGEGRYKYVFNALINKKDIKIEKGDIIVDVTSPYLSLSASEDVVLVDKEKNKFSKTIAFALNVGDENEIDLAKTKLQIVNYSGNIVKEWSFDKVEDLSRTIYWDGKDDVYGFVIPAGEYKAILTAYDVFNNGSSLSVSITALEQVKGSLSEIVVKEEPRGLVVNLSSNVLFATGKYVLKKEATASLNETVRLLNAYPANKVLIEGYTDSTGSKKTNLKLSYDRAQAVYSYFVKKGIKPERLSAVGYGPENPVATNKTAAGRAKNRRVNIIILKSQKEEVQEFDDQQELN